MIVDFVVCLLFFFFCLLLFHRLYFYFFIISFLCWLCLCCDIQEDILVFSYVILIIFKSVFYLSMTVCVCVCVCVCVLCYVPLSH